MSHPISEILSVLEKAYPYEGKESFDNCGLLVGARNMEASRVLVSLDITDAVIQEAVEKGASLILSHHPLFFAEDLKTVTDDTPIGRKVLNLVTRSIAAICMHTNADAADEGVNDMLADAFGLLDRVSLGGGDSGRIGRVGELPKEWDIDSFAAEVKAVLDAPGVRYLSIGRPVRRLAVGGGACGGMIDLAVNAGADTFLTSDVRYHQWQQAREAGIHLLDAGHFSTENLICRRFYDLLSHAFPDLCLEISQVNRDFCRFV